MPTSRRNEHLVRPLVRRLNAYIPGEQPRVKGLIKLNTNENPYPPSPKVLDAVRQAVDGRLRLYPNPTAQRLREKLAKLHGCEPDNIVVGNGSDELLAMATRAFVEPAGEEALAKSHASAQGKDAAASSNRVQFFQPSYSLYPVLAEIQGAVPHPVSLRPDFSLPTVAELRRGKRWDFEAALTLITTPNAPTGRGFSTADLSRLCAAQRGVVVLDEAYVDFADEHAMELALRGSNTIVSRTFSKAYSLCFQRVGYFVGPRTLIDGLQKIRDSYNVNGLGQVAAEATLADLAYYRRGFRTVCRTREHVAAELTALGFRVLPSQTNFLFARPPVGSAKEWLDALRARRILVRWFDHAEIREYLRITIGSEAEMDQFLQVTRKLLS